MNECLMAAKGDVGIPVMEGNNTKLFFRGIRPGLKFAHTCLALCPFHKSRMVVPAFQRCHAQRGYHFVESALHFSVEKISDI